MLFVYVAARGGLLLVCVLYALCMRVCMVRVCVCRFCVFW